MISHTRASRRDFTAAEDRFLAEYIALRIPEAEAGGRMGNKIYMELVEHAWEVRFLVILLNCAVLMFLVV